MRKIKYVTFIILVMCLSLAAKLPDTHISVLCYHHVDLKMNTPYTVTSEQLTNQMNALMQSGFSFVTLKQIDDYMYNGKSIPSKSVAITFDDGNHNTATKAFPILKKLGIPFAAFIYPSGINVGHKSGFMDWDDVRMLQKNGVIIGCHSFDHPYMTRPSGIKTAEAYKVWLQKESVGAKKIIEAHIGVSVNYFALPFGLSDIKVYKKVKNSGYRFSFNVSGMNNSQYSDPYFYNRFIVVKSDTPENVVSKASIRPIYFEYTYPSKLSRITTPDVLAEYKIFHADDYDLKTATFHLGKPAHKGYQPETDTLNIEEVGLTKEAYYQATVIAKDKNGRSCMGNWAFIYQKTIPAYVQD